MKKLTNERFCRDPCTLQTLYLIKLLLMNFLQDILIKFPLFPRFRHLKLYLPLYFLNIKYISFILRLLNEYLPSPSLTHK